MRVDRNIKTLKQLGMQILHFSQLRPSIEIFFRGGAGKVIGCA